MSNHPTIPSTPVYKKIVKLYSNYGIDAAEMEEDEVTWLLNHYSANKDLLERDLKNSEVHKDKFEDLI